MERGRETKRANSSFGGTSPGRDVYYCCSDFLAFKEGTADKWKNEEKKRLHV